MAERIPKKMMSQWYPQPHSLAGSFSFEVDDGTLDSTILPIAFYDEGLGTPSALETHPENSAFAIVADRANCFVDSRINLITAELRFSLTSKFNDDNLNAIRFATMPIFMAFIDDYTTIDELSSIEIQDVLEMQTESTDRQGGPLFVAAKDMAEKFTNSANIGADQAFLDTDASLEAVAFSPSTYYNALQFLTIKEKLKKVQGGLKWETLTNNRPFIKKKYFIRPKTKRMNPFTFFGILVHVPVQGNETQLHVITRDLTAATQYVDVDFNIRYNEWNENFNHKKV